MNHTEYLSKIGKRGGQVKSKAKAAAARLNGRLGGRKKGKAKMKIKQGHYYVLADHPGISGFKDYSKKVECVVSAEKARSNRQIVSREYLANGMRFFRLDDGHLPEYQPRAREVQALEFLDANPFAEIVEVARM